VQGLPGVVEVLGVAALPLEYVGEDPVGVGLPGRVAGLAVQIEGVP
jgi:hypothetical protein